LGSKGSSIQFSNESRTLIYNSEKAYLGNQTLESTTSSVMKFEQNIKYIKVENAFSGDAPLNGDGSSNKPVIFDINNDGYLDILYVGNNFANEVAMGRYDASNGGVLLGNGKGFTYAQNSGIMVPADAKSLVGIQVGSELVYVALQNRGPMRVFKPRLAFEKDVKPGQSFSYSYKGRKQKMDWNYGSSYLSQSASAQAFLPKGAKLN
jgi:hypothetical protein